MWVWLFVGILIGGAMGAVTMCLVQDKREDLLWQDLFRKFLKTDVENFDLLLKCADLQVELEDERYRHDRVQDFCVKQSDQLDAAKEKLRWIPISERLPELIPCDAGTAYSEAVNILTSGRKVLTAIWNGTDFIADAEFWDAEGEEITHWAYVLLPLSEPPAGNEIAASPHKGAPRNDSVLSEAGADG